MIAHQPHQFGAYTLLRYNPHLVRLSKLLIFTAIRKKYRVKFKKIDREFLLGDSSLNVYKYRLLTSGYLFDEFKKNPIGYYMHGTKEYDREAGVLVKWEDLRMDGDKIYGKPTINLSHPRGQRTVDEIESGFLNAASFGHIVAMEISDNPADYLAGQEGPTVTKWFNRECSLVDIPGNYNAVAAELYDTSDEILNLSDFSKPQILKMKQLFLTPDLISKLNLKADVTQEEANTTLANLVAEAAKVPDLTAQLTTAHTAKKKAEDDLDELKKTTVQKEVADLVAAGIAGKKITKELGDTLKTDYKENPTGLKKLIDAMPAYTPVTDQLKDDSKTDLAAKTWDELDKTGQLENLKANSPDVFFAKYETKFGKPHPEKK
jgi:hypothetical protein